MLLILDVKLGLFPVLELRMLLHGNRDVGAAPEDQTISIELGLLTVDTEATKRVSAQLLVHSLHEAIQQVVGEVKLLTFFGLAENIVAMPEGQVLVVPFLIQTLKNGLLILCVDELSLEVEEIE